MQSSCMQDNRNFTLFAEPCILHIHLSLDRSLQPLPHAPIIGCLHTIASLIIWVKTNLPWPYRFVTEW